MFEHISRLTLQNCKDISKNFNPNKKKFMFFFSLEKNTNPPIKKTFSDQPVNVLQ